MIIAIIIVIAVLYAAHHGKHVHRNYYRHRMSLWVSLRGPWGTRISKRL
jgi:hypothetical protein